MSQNSVVMPTSGIVSGVTFAQDVNNGLDSFRTMFSGSAAPSADTPEEGQLWLDTGTSTIYKLVRIYDGSTWPIRAYLDDANHIHFTPVAGGISTVASASTTALGLSTTPSVTPAISISGTTGISSFGSNAIVGQIYFITFQGTLTLTYNSTSFILPGKANITTAAGDMSIWQYLGSGNWQCLVYQPIATLVGSVGTVTGAFITNNFLEPAQITANQNDYAPTNAANGTIWDLTSDGLSDYVISGISASQSAGRQITVRNNNASGGGRFIFTNQSTLSSTGNRFLMPGVISLNPKQSLQLFYDSTANAWIPQNTVVAQPALGMRRNLQCGNVAGLGFAAPTTPASQYKITADQLVLADADSNTVNLMNVSVTATITSVGANGLDSTAAAGLSTGVWYSGWVIYNALTNTAAALLSTSSTAPTLPSGYTFKARCGWVPTYNSTTKNLTQVFQTDRYASYVMSTTVSGSTVWPRIATGVAGTISNSIVIGSAVGIGPFYPPTAGRVKFGVQANGNLAALVPSSIAYGSAGSPIEPIPPWEQAFSNSLTPGEFALLSTNVYWAAGAGSQFADALGWEDNL